MDDFFKFEQDVKQRGRPRKQMQPFRFGQYVYKTPLGFQYTQPRLLAHTLQTPVYTRTSAAPEAPASPPPAPRARRAAAVRAAQASRRARSSSSSEVEDTTSSASTVEEDPYERLLAYDPSNDSYHVKLRNRSYLHCEWISADDIRATRAGAMKIKRFKPAEADPAYTEVDRVLAETYEDGEHYVLIKWNKLPHELATFELWEDAERCPGFEAAMQALRDRKRMRHMRMSIDWRPPREQQLKFTESPQYRHGNTLRPYQLEGLNWLLNRWYFRQSCIMADEMGLGKTVQSVVFVNALFTQFEYTAPVLVIAPLSTLVHWEREFQNWTDLRVLTYHGSIAGRGVINDYEFQVRAGNITVRLFDVLITTYEMAMAGSEHLLPFDFGVGIFDEAHRLKNPQSKAACCLRAFSIRHRVLLSGTPIQNNLNELWALFNFIDPQRFTSLAAFLEEYRMEKTEDVERLQALLKPLMLRRMKEDVETSIPMKEETIVEVELTMLQKRYYRAILEKNIEFLARDDRSNAPNLINAMMELRKCCVHPFLLTGAEEKILADHARRHPDRVAPDPALLDCPSDATPVRFGDYWFPSADDYYRVLIQSSGKLVLLDKLLAKLFGAHKVLIFSQMTRCLDLLAEYLAYRGYTYERIDGGVRGDQRQAAIDRFSAGEAFVFLLCTRAGGVGINLTAADTVVIFDSDWNPQNDLQAQARCHRIGQKNEVKIYRLVTRNSYEREMFDKAGMKLGLDRAILQRMSFDQPGEGGEAPARKEDAIQLLLRKGAYGVLMETDDVSHRFCEEDIDQILERRTQVVRHSDGGNVFSKATFQVEEEVADPDFWDNLLSQKKSEENEGRVKRQCRRLAREGVLSEEDRETLGGWAAALEGRALDREDEIFRIFIDVLLNGAGVERLREYSGEAGAPEEAGVTEKAAGSSAEGAAKSQERVAKDGGADAGAKPLINFLIKYCTDLIENPKLKSDYSAHMEHFHTDYDPNLFLRHASAYLRFHEHFLLRVQISQVLAFLMKTEDMVPERARGWSVEDDRCLLDTVLMTGYDVKPCGTHSREESNQHLRKILSGMYHRKEIKDNDNMYFKAILNFGRLTEHNELAVERFLCKDITRMSVLVDKICGMTRRARRDGPEADCYERIMFFDKLAAMEEVPAMRRNGMPKRWDHGKDEALRDYLLGEGMAGVEEKFGVSEEQTVKRFEAMFKSASKE